MLVVALSVYLTSCTREVSAAPLAAFEGGEIQLFSGGFHLTEPGPSWEVSSCPALQDDVVGEINGSPIVFEREYLLYSFGACDPTRGTPLDTPEQPLVRNYPGLDRVVLRQGDLVLETAAPGIVPLEAWPLTSHPLGRVELDSLGTPTEPLTFDPQLPSGITERDRANPAPLRLHRPDDGETFWLTAELEIEPGGQMKILLPPDLPVDDDDLETTVYVTFKGKPERVECAGFDRCLPPAELTIPVAFSLDSPPDETTNQPTAW